VVDDHAPDDLADQHPARLGLSLGLGRRLGGPERGILAGAELEREQRERREERPERGGEDPARRRLRRALRRLGSLSRGIRD
jgi:hypothetical protein